MSGGEAHRSDAYPLLRRDILELRLKPGTILSIQSLCAHYGSGRSPMRDTLLRLAQEGLVTLLPQRGTMISKIDFRRVEEERFLRVSVEREVTVLFLQCRTPADEDFLERSVAEQASCIAHGRLRAFLAADDDFHRRFYRAAGKDWCAETVESVSGHYRRVRLLSLIDSSISAGILAQHREMTAAIRENDGQRLLGIFNRHLQSLDDEKPRFFRAFPELFEDVESDGTRNDDAGGDFLRSLVPSKTTFEEAGGSASCI